MFIDLPHQDYLCAITALCQHYTIPSAIITIAASFGFLLSAVGLNANPLALMVPAKNYSLRREASICKFATSEKGVQVWGSNLTNFRQCKLEVLESPFLFSCLYFPLNQRSEEHHAKTINVTTTAGHGMSVLDTLSSH